MVLKNYNLSPLSECSLLIGRTDHRSPVRQQAVLGRPDQRTQATGAAADSTEAADSTAVDMDSENNNTQKLSDGEQETPAYAGGDHQEVVGPPDWARTSDVRGDVRASTSPRVSNVVPPGPP